MRVGKAIELQYIVVRYILISRVIFFYVPLASCFGIWSELLIIYAKRNSILYTLYKIIINKRAIMDNDVVRYNIDLCAFKKNNISRASN